MASKLSLFLTEVKRRRVWQMAVAYLAVGTAIAIGIPDLFAAMLLPEWAARLVIVPTILGFPVALAPAWALQDIFAVQSEVAEAVARALATELSGQELAGIHEHPTDDVAAYALFLEGMAAINTFERDQYARALGLFERTLRIAPDFARAHAGLALLLTFYPIATLQLPPRYHERPRAAARRALELDPSSGHALLAWGSYLWGHERDWIEAEKALDRALELEPQDPDVMLLRAYWALMLGRFHEAIAHFDRLEAMGQYPPMAEVWRAHIETYRAEYDELDFDVPIRRLGALIAAEQATGYAELHRGTALLWSGRLDEGLDAVEASLRSGPDVPLAHELRGAILGRMGRREEALAEDQCFRRSGNPESADRFCWAVIHFAIGDLDLGFDLMEEGMDSRTSILLPFFRLLPTYRPLWSQPRFLAIMDAIWPGEHKQVLGEYGWQPGG
jgi:tetratricopeptide (TPR) repeat protein